MHRVRCTNHRGELLPIVSKNWAPASDTESTQRLLVHTEHVSSVETKPVMSYSTAEILSTYDPMSEFE